jgi:hypothetical protein
VGPLLAGGRSQRRFQEPPEVVAVRAVLVFVSLPAGKARLRRRMVAVSAGGLMLAKTASEQDRPEDEHKDPAYG